MITAPEIDTDLLWSLSAFFVVLALLYFISVFFFRNKISSRSSQVKQRKAELSPMVSEFLFYEDGVDKSEKTNYIRLKIEIRDLLREDFNRKILSQILLDLRKDVSGDTRKRLFKLYHDLSLEKDAFKKLKSWRWEVVSKGILELTLMQVEEAYPFIVKFINDRRGTIRKQAEIATVSLKPGGISYFLDTTKYKISEWQQLKLLDVLRNKEDFEPPRFKAWLTSTNTHVVLFALRLIKYYNQNDANSSLVELVKHKDRQVKQQAIECLKEFHVTQALPTLKGVFPKCTVDTKLGILGAIAELGNTSDIEFLETVSQREGNFSVKSKAVGAINTIAPESVLPTENIEFVPVYQKPEDSKDSEKTIIENPANLEHTREGPEKHPLDEQPATSDSELDETSDLNNDNQLPLIPTAMTHPKKPDKPLREIEVEVEEVRATSCEGDILTEASSENTAMEETYCEDREASDTLGADLESTEILPDVDDKTEASHFDVSKIHFLPLVVAEETETISNENLTDFDSEIPQETFDIEVFHEEISTDLMDEELQGLIAEINELDFLPVVVDDRILPDTELDTEPSFDPSDEMQGGTKKSLEELEGYCLSDFEVSFEEKDVVDLSEENETVTFDLEDAPIIDVVNPNLPDVMSWLLADNELRELELNYEAVPYSSHSEISSEHIPDPVYYDEHEAYMMGLLDDLEELGDIREIPLLEELRAEERKSFIKERITTMIEKFSLEPASDQKSSVKTVNENGDLPVFSVFADLFKNIDNECKLILLEEIVPVGDEKEIEFLDGLLDDPDQRIRKKAQTVLKLLIAKLSHENPQALQNKGISNIVSEQEAIVPNEKDERFDHLLSELEVSPAMHPEIFNINFELSEILDKKCDQKIFDIPVVATEVSHTDRSSFFDSLKKFTKIFF